MGFIFLLLLVGTILFVKAKYFAEPEPQPVITDAGRTRAIQLEVVNAAGVQKLAQRTTDYLRSCGFDVVEMRTHSAGMLEQTVVINRTRNASVAKFVSRALGLPDERVMMKPDPNLYLDVSVILGKDYRILKPLQDL